MNTIYEKILTLRRNGKKMFAILLDPEKCVGEKLANTLLQLRERQPDFIFIGGSTTTHTSHRLIDALKNTTTPKVLFPGDVTQFCPTANALLFLSLISGDNPTYLIGQHRIAARRIKQSGIEVIPTGYILIDGGKRSAVERVSQTVPIASIDNRKVVDTAIAGELLGMRMIYLEAGSGANNPVSDTIIKEVKQALNIPLIVGGGITTPQQLQTAYESGADMVVVGNLFETHPTAISTFIRLVERMNQ